MMVEIVACGCMALITLIGLAYRQWKRRRVSVGLEKDWWEVLSAGLPCVRTRVDNRCW
jgi:hypothetical protein